MKEDASALLFAAYYTIPSAGKRISQLPKKENETRTASQPSM
ncbi:hypothetical protein LL3_02519 [Bacillus amyloliquefaciens LL3]|nr:hypothetical protein LL3_02519 [Bacillus amyloliquefaciens LL3]